jgi:hypothetical protein
MLARLRAMASTLARTSNSRFARIYFAMPQSTSFCIRSNILGSLTAAISVISLPLASATSSLGIRKAPEITFDAQDPNMILSRTMLATQVQARGET